MSISHSPHSDIPSATVQPYSNHPTSPLMSPAVVYAPNMPSPVAHVPSANTSNHPSYRMSRRASQENVHQHYEQPPIVLEQVSPFGHQLDRKLTHIEHQNFQGYRQATAEDSYLDPQDENYDPDESFCLTIFCLFALVLALFCLAAVIYLIVNDKLTPTWPFWKQESTVESHSHLSVRSFH